jgi:two-component system, NarL family, sensor histidine kinase DevS
VADRGSRLVDELLSASPDALVVVSADGIIEEATAAVQSLFGYAPEQLVGKPVETLLPDRLRLSHVGLREVYLDHPEVRPMGALLDLRAVRQDGSEIRVDISLVPTHLEGRVRVGAFVRDATDRLRGETLLRFVNEISLFVLEGGDTAGLLDLAAARVRALVDGVVAWVSIRSDRGDQIEVAAAEGRAAGSLRGARVAVATSLAAQAMSSGSTVSVEDMTTHPAVLAEARIAGLGPGLYLPMLAESGPVGSLVVARSTGAPAFSPSEVNAAEVFASAAAIVLALDTARQALEETRLISEHERIARDLHDTVIQRLFALGMGLQAAGRLAPDPVAEWIRDTVDSIDEVIREIRETIFDLNRPDSDTPYLRQQVRMVAAEAAEHLGFGPRLAFRGPVEAAVTDEMTGHLLAVLREALANVGRHARASSVDVVVSVEDGQVTLSVADDGIGISDSPSAGQGTINMRSRAETLGGSFTVGRRSPSGTRVQWRVPCT